MEPEVSSPCSSQNQTNDLDLNQFSPSHIFRTFTFIIYFNIILLFMPRSPKWSFLLGFNN
jgi:hypothetical protein